MKLKEIFVSLKKAELFGPGDVEVTSLAYHSQRVKKGALFAAITGFATDGHKYINEAIDKGAAALLVEKGGPYPVPYIKVDDTRLALALISSHFYGQPARELTVIGVTGTNGKTTTTFMIESILKAQGYRVGLMGTILQRFGTWSQAGERTTPESLDLHKFLANVQAGKGTHVVMEVSSHALKLKRVGGISFDVGVFTNLTPEHGEFHTSFADYLNTKALLFRKYLKPGGTAVINGDDSYAEELLGGYTGRKLIYSLGKKADLTGHIQDFDRKGLTLIMEFGTDKTEVNLNLTGEFNAANSLAAAGVGLALGIDLSNVKRGLESLKGVPGRFETVGDGDEFGIIVDYAHSPDGLNNLLRNARRLTGQKLIVVFGCGGDRDPQKRPAMAGIAARWADVLILTSDNPRSEEPEVIINQMETALKGTKVSYEKHIGRRQAIQRAVAIAGKNDLVVIAGKGHEREQVIGDKKIIFDDREVALAALKARKGENT